MTKLDQEEATEVEVLVDVARKVRRRTLALISEAGYGFLGPCFSCVDIIVCLGWSAATRCFATESNDHANLILSKGHAAAALYAALAEHDGDGEQEVYAEFDSPLQAHPNSARLPRVMVSSGSVGQAIPVAVGVALAEKLHGRRNRTYVLSGDGELQAGVVWEALLAASSQKAQPNLVLIVDANGFSQPGACRLSKVRSRWSRQSLPVSWRLTATTFHKCCKLSTISSNTKAWAQFGAGPGVAPV